jgi:hypothetical protein
LNWKKWYRYGDSRKVGRWRFAESQHRWRRPKSTAGCSARGELVAFGGKDYRFTFRNRTLRFVEDAWQEVSADGPQPRINPGLAYHGARQQVVLYGGRAEGDKALDDLWLWDGTRWSRSS